MGMELKVSGMFLIMLAFVFYVFLAPSLVQSVDTRPTKALENETPTTKNIYNAVGFLIPMIPLVIFFLGTGLLWKG